MNHKQPSQLLEETVKLSQFLPDRWEEFEFDEQETWLLDLLEELENGVREIHPNLTPGSLKLKLSLKRRVEKPYGDHLLAKSQLKGQYSVACVRCLTKIEQNLNLSFNGVFLAAHFDCDPEYEKVLTLFIDGGEFDLYFHNKGKANLREFIQEQINMTIDPFPLHDPNCQGLCSTCGADLNKENCGHGQCKGSKIPMERV